MELTHKRMGVGGIELHVVQAGPEEAPLVVLLHGFPETWEAWRAQIEPLAEAGYRVWAPDQRGYNLSDKPSGVEAYRLSQLAGDVVELIDATGQARAAIVGHDWGAAVAWYVAERHPERVARLGILNVPHPRVMVQTLRRSPRQLLRSWYILFFQLRGLAERLLSVGNWAPLVGALKRTSRPGTFSEEILASYRRAWSQPGAMTAMLNWYRAAFRGAFRPRSSSGVSSPGGRKSKPIKPPTLILWGVKDAALGREMVEPSLALCEAGESVYFEQASHWVQHEEAAAVNKLLLDFLEGCE